MVFDLHNLSFMAIPKKSDAHFAADGAGGKGARASGGQDAYYRRHWWAAEAFWHQEGK